MLRNYLKIAVRTLWKHKGFSAINVFGLALSMGVCLLILLFVVDQKSYDRFHTDSDRLYRVYSDYKAAINGRAQLYATTPITLAKVLRDEAPGVAAVAPVRRFGGTAEHAGRSVPLSGLYADPDFFDVFSFGLTAGDAATALAEPYALLLAPEAATRLFGTDDPLGQPVEMGGATYTVAGLLAEPPGPSHLAFEALASFVTLETAPQHAGLFNTWHSANRSSYTFVRFADNADPEALAAAFPSIIERHYPGDEEAWLAGLHLQPLTDINLGQIMDNQLGMALPAVIAYFLVALALVIMGASCFNYMSLSVARSLTRAREVGMRRVVGASRGQLLRQFLTEAVVVALVALVVALGVLLWLLPGFNQLWFINFSGTQIQLNPLTDGRVYVLFLGFSVGAGLLAGLYPAFYLARYEPLRVLKGVLRQPGHSGFRLRKALVVMQFALSVFFFISALLLYQQFQFMTQAEFGFDADDIVNVQLQDVPYDVFRQQLAQHPAVATISAASLVPMEGSRSDAWMRTEGMDQPEKGYRLAIDEHFLGNLGLTLLAGRNFSQDFSADTANVLLSAKAVQRLGFATPEATVGQTITLFDDWHRTVVGVVADFHTNSMIMDIDPLVLTYEPDRYRTASVRAVPGQLAAVEAHLAEAWPALGTATPLDAIRYTTQIEQDPGLLLYRDFLRIVGLITGFAVLIACLGLLGMATFAAETRVKEVGIRKVLGASVASVILLLSKEFLRLIALALVLALPLAWFVNGLWLDALPFRVDLGVPVFALGAGVMLALALVTIGSQATRAARTNPVETLRQG